jgi:hypothetical protein
MRYLSVFAGFNFIIALVLCGLSIYCLILFIKLATRGIKALDIYISKNGENKNV